ncbi:cation/H(+) antiporter 15 [Zea mays]|uniref:Cation/H(+) antiporter 14 n=2 Tax=Zea mays TaxID=4577 RepID=A0A1D6NQ37_MAIZE|nr:cation/H(+) antiporter 15 [Zea mays]ONM42065.1 Cation/H(+) antiporter 14 [Zea mays]|eukprot:XP_020406214.1 cation/H(+) antiporter 15-like [Zea mays]
MTAVANLSSGALEATAKPLAAACYDNNLVNSQGMFLGDQPLRFSLPLLLVQVSVILVLSAAAHVVLRRLGQSRFVTHMLVGIFLGPSVLGRNASFRDLLFSERGTYILESVSLVALILFLFSMGVKTDLSLLRRPSGRAVAVGITGAVVPLAITLPVFHALQPSLPEDLRGSSLVTELAVRLSLSSFPVVADALSDLDLLNTDLGRIALTASLITDVTSWFLRACSAAVFLVSEAMSPAFTARILASFVAFVLFVGFVARPAGRYIAYKRTPTGALLSEGSFVVVVIAALLSALVTDAIGFKYMIGPMMLGLALPGGMPIGATMTERLDSFFIALFLPVYMALSGYRTDFSKAEEASERWCALELFVVLCVSGKLVGCVAAGLFFAMPFRDAAVLALMLNIRGIVEVAAINSWGDSMKATAEHYSTLTLAMVLITAVSTPLIKLLYDPSGQFARAKRRSLEHARMSADLRVLTCLYSEDHAAPLIDLLEASGSSRDSPVSLIVLHLTELVGRAASVLKPHRKSTSSGGNPTSSDRIVNAFRYLEQQAAPGAVTVSPYVAQAPFSSMHHDVCSLAHSRKANLILLPFHKSSDGARSTANNAIRSINRSVLQYAPCSVAILVDHGLASGSACATAANSLLQRAALYFLGGADDREALAYAARMPETGTMSLTVVRFKLRNWVGMGGRDEARDEELLQEFWSRHRDNERVVYVEKTVEDAEGTASVVRAMSEKFDLLIVGRRGGEGEGDPEGSTALTSGLSEWSEFPELGVLGDMLASAEFASKVSILVIQQQPPKKTIATGSSVND